MTFSITVPDVGYFYAECLNLFTIMQNVIMLNAWRPKLYVICWQKRFPEWAVINMTSYVWGVFTLLINTAILPDTFTRV